MKRNNISAPKKGRTETPGVLADLVVQLASQDEASTWLDPCAGSGQLVEAAIRAGVSKNAILAVDLQRELPRLTALGVEKCLGVDFLDWARTTSRRFDRVIANPPYIRIRELQESLARSALDLKPDEVKVARTGNYWVPFLVGGMRVLNRGGTLVYILPAAWEYANYAKDVRALCGEVFCELDVHRVDKPMFDDVDDGAVIIVGRGYAKDCASVTRHFRYPNLDMLIESTISCDGRFAREDIPTPATFSLKDDEVSFMDIADVRLGAVTGDARYFLLRESERLTLNLPLSTVRPILSRAKHLLGPQIDADIWTKLLEANERIWLFWPSEGDLADPHVRSYLELSEQAGGCRRDSFKVNSRDPWYQVPIPDTFDAFLTGMSERRIWVSLNCLPDLTVSNTLYGIRFKNCATTEEKAAWCLSMLSTATARSRSRLIRRYPQGLVKLEPSDIAQLVLRRPKRIEGASALYRMAVQLMLSGDYVSARRLVDRWLE